MKLLLLLILVLTGCSKANYCSTYKNDGGLNYSQHIADYENKKLDKKLRRKIRKEVKKKNL